MRVAAHLVAGGRSLGHEHTLPEEDTSVTQNLYGPHILQFSFHSFIFEFFQLEDLQKNIPFISCTLLSSVMDAHIRIQRKPKHPLSTDYSRCWQASYFSIPIKYFQFFPFKLATAYWLDTAGHPSLDSSDCSSISPFSTHFVSQSSNESPGPWPHLRARVKNAHPQINDRVRVNREWWRRRNLPSSQSAVAALSSRGRGNPVPQEVSLQFQSFKVFSQSFKVPTVQNEKGETVIH